MKKYINTSNYYLTTITTKITNDQASLTSGTFDVADVTVDNVTLPLKGYYWVDVDFGDTSKREIFRIKERVGYTLHYDARISPSGAVEHPSGASVGLRDFSQLLNSLSTNTDNFGEVEQTGNLSVIVRGGTIYNTSNMNAETGKITLPPTTSLTFNPNTTTYIVLQYNEEFSAWRFEKAINLDLKEEGQYPIAKIVTGSAMIDADDGIIDLRSMIIGLGNMRAEVYDPEGKRKELYLMDNMEQSEDGLHMFVSQAQIDLWDSYQETKQPLLISGQNIVTINGKSIIDVSAWENGNVPLDTILTCGWETYTTENGVSSFTFTDNVPLTPDAFIVFTDSGTMMVGGENNDYVYDDTTHTITFNEPLASTEHAYIWMMYNNSGSSIGIGSGTITIKWGEGEGKQKSFNVNQDSDETIDIGEAANDSTITITQGGKVDQSFTTNQSNDSTINLQGIIASTQSDYDDLPDSKLTDGNWYFIYE